MPTQAPAPGQRPKQSCRCWFQKQKHTEAGGYTETAEGHLSALQHPTTKTKSSLPNVAHEVAPEPTATPDCSLSL